MYRKINRLIQSQPTSDGQGVQLSRALTPSMEGIDPFLLLDEISSDDSADYIGGFPEHPHRGFETVTYMLQGKMRHRDHMGNEGLLEDGSVQWMTAGRGVIHSEMPEQTEGVLHGFQLWLNLPSKDKMQAAAYQEFAAEDFPVIYLGDKPQLSESSSQVKVIAGTFSQGAKQAQIKTEGPVKNIATDAHYYDVQLNRGDDLSFDTPQEHTVLLYCYQGQMTIAGKTLKQGQTALLTEGDAVQLQALDDARFLSLSATPIGEPVVNYGPFVMNSSEEIEQAILDYQQGNLTEERAAC